MSVFPSRHSTASTVRSPASAWAAAAALAGATPARSPSPAGVPASSSSVQSLAAVVRRLPPPPVAGGDVVAEVEEAARAIKCGRNARPIAALSKQEKEDVINRMEQTISVGLHFSNMNPDRFYRTVYLRGDRVLASDLNKLLPESKHPLPYQFGVDMPHLTNREAVVELERFGMESLSAEEVKWLEKHAEARRSEIHPPITSKAKLSAYLHTHWRAIELPSEQECACLRPHIDCVIGRSLPMHPNSKTIDLAQLSLLLRQMHDENEQFLSRIGTDRAMGAVWYSMDSVFSRLSIFTDQDEPLQDLIRDSLERALLPG